MNKAPYVVKGFRLFDTVHVNGKEWYIHGRRLKGAFALKRINETLEITPSKIRLISHNKSLLTERRTELPFTTKVTSPRSA